MVILSCLSSKISHVIIWQMLKDDIKLDRPKYLSGHVLKGQNYVMQIFQNVSVAKIMIYVSFLNFLMLTMKVKPIDDQLEFNGVTFLSST